MYISARQELPNIPCRTIIHFLTKTLTIPQPDSRVKNVAIGVDEKVSRLPTTIEMRFFHRNGIMTRLTFRFSMMLAAAALSTTQFVHAQNSIVTSAKKFLTPPAATVAAPQDTVVDANIPVNETYFDPGSTDYSVANGYANDNGLLGFGYIKRSDHAFDDFISPMTNPVFFEDPRNLTEARAIFANHKVPIAAGGGDVQVYALQLRARLSENVSLIATKDGYITSSNPLISGGWADLAVGLKFNLLRNAQSQRLLSAGFTFELPTGEASALQGNGDGELHLFMTGGRAIGARGHWLSAGGIRAPINTTDESSSVYMSNHFDFQIRRGLYFLAETNWFHWTKSGKDGAIPGIEGLDLFNLGSPGVAGNDIVTSAVGMKLKPNGNNELGVAFEFPLTAREDIIDNRLTVDWIIRY